MKTYREWAIRMTAHLCLEAKGALAEVEGRPEPSYGWVFLWTAIKDSAERRLAILTNSKDETELWHTIQEV